MESEAVTQQLISNPEWLDRFIGINDILLVDVIARLPGQKVLCKILKRYSNIYSKFSTYYTDHIEFVYTGGALGYPTLDAGKRALVPLRILPGIGMHENFHPRHFQVVEIDGTTYAVWCGRIAADDLYFPESIRLHAQPWGERPDYSMIRFDALERYIEDRLPFVHDAYRDIALLEISKLRTLG
jgi:hypothetical protein